MCGRYFLNASLDEVAAAFGAHAVGDVGVLPRFNIAPGRPAPVVRASETGPEIVALDWGFIPPWEDAPKPINARGETAHEKPMFRDAFRHRRCIIPATGFYEWKTEGDAQKQPFAAVRDGGTLFAMAGLWSPEHASDEARGSFTILTCPANARLRPLHERMPVVLPPVDWSMWIEPRVEGVGALRALIKPDAAKHWDAWPVSRRVNNPRYDEPTLLERHEEHEGGLFG